MARIRVPIPSTVSDGDGRSYICFAEGHPRADGEIDVKLAFALKDESRFHRTPGVECRQPNEEALAAWASALSIDHLSAALLRALSSRRRDSDVTLRTRTKRV